MTTQQASVLYPSNAVTWNLNEHSFDITNNHPNFARKKKLLFSLNKKCLRRVQHHQKQRHERTARGCKGRKEEVKRGLESLFFFSLHFENVSWCLRQLVTQSWVVFGTVKRQFSISREAEELLFSSFAHFFIPLASPRVQQSERQWDLQSLAWEHPSQSLFRGD